MLKKSNILLACVLAASSAQAAKPVKGDALQTAALSCSTEAKEATTIDLLEVYQRAKQHDPEYLAAIETWRSAREALPQGFAGVLPVIAFTANISTNKNETNGVKTPSFSSRGWSGTLTQPVIDVSAWETVRQASAQVKQARAQLVAAEQSLITRVAAAYFNALLAEDTLKFVRDEREATKKQFDQVAARFRVGLVARSEKLSAQTQLDKVLATEVSAKNAVENTTLALEQITGYIPGYKGYPKLAKLYTKKRKNCSGKKVFIAKRPTPDSPGDWVKTALQGNPGFVASRYGVSAASANLGVKAAGHLPTVDLTGALTRSDNNNKTFPTNSFNQVAKLEVTVPLFTGGGTFSRTRQAYFDYEKAKALRLQQERSVVASTRQDFNNVTADINQIRANKQAVKSTEEDVKVKQSEKQQGSIDITDLLDAISDSSEAQKNLSEAQYAYFNDMLALKSDAGTLQDSDVIAMNQYFVK